MSDTGIIAENVRNHVVICNWNDLGDQIVRELRSSVIAEQKPIIIVTDDLESLPAAMRGGETAFGGNVIQEQDDPYEGVFIVPGNPTNERVLLRAAVKSAETAIVLSDPREGDHADAKSVLIALAIEAIEPEVHTIVEILKSKNRIHFQHTLVDEIVCIDEFSEKLLSQSALTHGLSDFYMRLLTATEDTNEVYLVEVPERFVGKTFREVEEAVFNDETEDAILIGIQAVADRLNGEQKVYNRFGHQLSERVLTINPPSKENLANRADLQKRGIRDRSYKLQEGDRLVLIAYHLPKLGKPTAE